VSCLDCDLFQAISGFRGRNCQVQLELLLLGEGTPATWDRPLCLRGEVSRNCFKIERGCAILSRNGASAGLRSQTPFRAANSAHSLSCTFHVQNLGLDPELELNFHCRRERGRFFMRLSSVVGGIAGPGRPHSRWISSQPGSASQQCGVATRERGSALDEGSYRRPERRNRRAYHRSGDMHHVDVSGFGQLH
jgi:hypothetical protein